MYHFRLLSGLSVYRAVAANETVKMWQDLIDCFCAGNPQGVLESYHRFYESAMVKGWPDLLIDLILDDQNVFSRLAAAKGAANISPSLKKVVARDLNILSEIATFDLESIKENNTSFFKEIKDTWNLPMDHPLQPNNWPEWNTIHDYINDSNEEKGLSVAAQWLLATRKKIKQELFKNSDWESFVDLLADYYAKTGYGIFNHFAAAYWKGDMAESGLVGLSNPDSIQLNELIGLDHEKQIVIENTEHFLAGLPANNIILYGSRGTGKSSMVKGLLNRYAELGLRLVQITKNDLPDFSRVYRMLAQEPLKFILFIDDLSFDDMEQEYKALKTMLEGGIAARPANVLIYATSNRMHLIKETHVEREVDIHSGDGNEEKLSLADRFGITVTFPSPDQESYLNIVESLAAQHHLKIDNHELRQLAIRWEMWHNGRSGRTAHQFIDHLIAQQNFVGIEL